MRILILVVACLALGACKNSTKQLENLADRACECAEGDTRCGNKILSELSTFAEGTKANGSAAFNQASIRLSECLTSAGVEQHVLTAQLEKMAR